MDDANLREADALLASLQAQLLSALPPPTDPTDDKVLSRVDDSALHAAAQEQAAAHSKHAALKARGKMSVLQPLRNIPISLDEKSHTGEVICYTDCMESSTLRFLQLMLCDLGSLGVSPQESSRASYCSR